MDVRIEESWQRALAEEFNKPYFKDLATAVREAYVRGQVYPPPTQLFAAFAACPLPQTKVVILGQDPYHGPGQAHGLAFSVPTTVTPPPSLQNIYKEIESDTGITTKSSGSLEHWATQGVLLLNTTLTVSQGQPGSHRTFGWETFTDAVITTISDQREHVVFLLWGSHARSKTRLIDQNKHLVLEAPHPSPLSAHRGFFGCRHFSRANAYLQAHGEEGIKW